MCNRPTSSLFPGRFPILFLRLVKLFPHAAQLLLVSRVFRGTSGTSRRAVSGLAQMKSVSWRRRQFRLNTSRAASKGCMRSLPLVMFWYVLCRYVQSPLKSFFFYFEHLFERYFDPHVTRRNVYNNPLIMDSHYCRGLIAILENVK